MIIFKTIAALQKFLQAKYKNEKVGFVPTMGALHAGHIKLITECAERSDKIVCSIFVNPTQFNNSSDLARYPVMLDKDFETLEAAGCDVVFVPHAGEIYPDNYVKPSYPLGDLENMLEGKFRPGHFQGVCQVVDRLLQIIQPDFLFLGQKDYQQCLVLTKLVEITGSKASIEIVPTVREDDGLAMSSRNLRLNDDERRKAAAIFNTLTHVANRLSAVQIKALKEEAIALLMNAGFRVDYLEIAAAADLTPINRWDGAQAIVILAAAYLTDVRLIDNFVITPNQSPLIKGS